MRRILSAAEPALIEGVAARCAKAREWFIELAALRAGIEGHSRKATGIDLF